MRAMKGTPKSAGLRRIILLILDEFRGGLLGSGGIRQRPRGLGANTTLP